MDGKEVKEALYTAFSVILISTVIICATMFSSLSYKSFNIKLKTDAINYNIKIKSELYNYFINPNSNISGVDIIDFIIIHDRAYRYEIITSDKTYKLSNKGLSVITNRGAESKKDAIDEFWTQAYITENILREDLYSKFKGTIVKDDGTVVEDIAEVNGEVWLKFEIIR